MAREKAVLGSYSDAARAYQEVMKIITEHATEIKDPYVIDRWDQFKMDIHKELKTLQ